jgi:dolichol-phosphate mannosyltransferase
MESCDTKPEAAVISTADAFAALQGLLGARVLGRMLATSGGLPLAVSMEAPEAERVSAILPVLDERRRLGRCLEGLIAQPATLGSILVVDGGSTDGTQALVRAYAARDARVRLIDASPVPRAWNGKAWNLACGLAASDPTAGWILTIDADVVAQPHLVTSLVMHGRAAGLDAFSAAPLLEVSGAAEAALHPAFLATLVYRFGLPGNVARVASAVQANGQCFLARRELLVATGAFAAARSSRCDDVTIARHLVRRGARLGFYEGSALASVCMYASARECWQNWPRSLALRDANTTPAELVLGLADVLFVQALPLVLTLAMLACGGRTNSLLFRVNAGLALARLGVLAGTHRAYAQPGAAYWLAALADLPVALRLVQSSFATSHVWRGRTLVAEGMMV